MMLICNLSSSLFSQKCSHPCLHCHVKGFVYIYIIWLDWEIFYLNKYREYCLLPNNIIKWLQIFIYKTTHPKVWGQNETPNIALLWLVTRLLPLLYAPCSCLSADGKVIVVGGMSTDTNPMDHMLSYDTETDRWQSLPSMPTARYASFAFLIHDKLYVLGKFSFPSSQQILCPR